MQDPSAKAQPGSPSRAVRSYVLRFISGKYQGGEFPVTGEKAIVVGRSSDLDMVLVEDMVSRKHARIAMQGEQIWIEDLGSTNGTFVNGEKIKRARLKEGDRVLIGTSILKLIAGDGPVDNTDVKMQLENVAAARKGSQQRTMSGSIEEVPLPDLLQLFGTSKKSGVLVIRTADEDVGRIYMRKGVIYHAAINESEEVPAMKSMYRMLTWEKGLFDLDPPDTRELPNEINVSVQEVLMEGMRQLDEFNQLRESLPDMKARISITLPLVAKLRELTPEQLDVLQLVYNHGTIDAVLNKSEKTDLDTLQAIVKLVKGSYIHGE